ncbi:MAG: hypothetical protein RL701_6680, partial [Pseudomonadota bacterium]
MLGAIPQLYSVRDAALGFFPSHVVVDGDGDGDG